MVSTIEVRLPHYKQDPACVVGALVGSGLGSAAATGRLPGREAEPCYADDTVQVLAARLCVDPEAVAAAAMLLSADERQHANRFAFDRERGRFVLARARLRQLLSAHLQVDPAAVEFQYGTRGKPALAHSFADFDLHFSVSHSEDIAVYAFARGRQVGVDVEAYREISCADDIAMRFFSESERDSYQTLHTFERPVGFFNCWTRKEAFVKALGDGLFFPLDRFDVSLTPGARAEIRRVDHRGGDTCGWSLHSFVPAAGFIGAVVVQDFAVASDASQ